MSFPPRIGFIGLGIMGAAMARNLVKAGFRVSVWNRDRSKTAEFAALGCKVHASPRDLAAESSHVILMVTGPEAADAVLEGPTGVFAAGFTGGTLINMSTCSLDYTRRLAARCFGAAVRFLDCPVSGSKPLAEAGTLVILAGGSAEDLEKASPILSVIGKAVVHAGPPPAGTALKLCMNLVVAQMSTALAESSALAAAIGLDPALIFRVFKESPALNCGYFAMKERNILSRTYDPAFALKNMLKDVRFMLEAAGGPERLPVTAAVEKLMAKSYNSGGAGQDLTVVAEALRRPAGTREEK